MEIHRAKYCDRPLNLVLLLLIVLVGWSGCQSNNRADSASSEHRAKIFHLIQDSNEIRIVGEGESEPVLVQKVESDFRPYIHPIMAPGTEVALTQLSPGHHTHQTGLYWGFTRVNGTGATAEEIQEWFYRPDKPREIQNKIGRDFFHHPDGEYWKKISAEVIHEKGTEVKWNTVYHILDETGNPILKETQTWTFAERGGKYFLDLEWTGEAITDIVINEFDYGGLFLRMPWRETAEAEVVNAARQKDMQAAGQRAMWVDVGMEINGLDQWGHIALFDHKENPGFPQPWRVDGQFGVGSAVSAKGAISIPKGEVLMYQYQVVAYTGELDDMEMDSLWGDYVGDQGMYNTASLWDIARQEGFEAEFLSPEKAVAAMTIENGYEVNVFASEPMISQPMAFCWDDKGRMWLAENRDYESRGDGFSNSGDSRIIILEDQDRDGQADSRKVFMEGIPFPSALAVGHGGVFIGAPPHLLFVPNKDDQADTDHIEILLTGWGIRDRHETINSLFWGPDGWLYGLEGFATPSNIRKPDEGARLYKPGDSFPKDIMDHEGTYLDGGVWRYHPLRKDFEVVAHGFSNPWGIDYNSKGELFITACVIPHLFQIFNGGFYHRQGGQHINPHVYEDIQTIVDHRHRSAHGGARIYQSDAFPSDQHGRIFMANIHDHAVLSDVLTADGSGYTASHGASFLEANNAQFVGFSMEIGPAGNLFVLDWHDADICGSSVLHKNTGRVYRITPVKSKARNWPGRYDDLEQNSDLELAQLQESRSDWHARRSRIILQYRASVAGIDPEAIRYLTDLLENSDNEDIRLRALWTLKVTANVGQDQLISFLADDAPYIRAWAARFLMEDRQPSPKVLQALINVAKNEPSPVVRLELAGALQRMEGNERWELARTLTRYAEDANDRNIPYMLWFGIEPMVVDQHGDALLLAQSSRIPSISRKIARRLVDGDKLAELVTVIASQPANSEQLLTGMLEGLEGHSDIQAPSNWEAAYKDIKGNQSYGAIADKISQRFGDVESTQNLLATLYDPDTTPEELYYVIGVLADQKNAELQELLPDLLENKELQMVVIQAIGSYDDIRLGEALFKKYPELDEAKKQAAILTLSSRPVYGRLILEGLKDGKLKRSDIPTYAVLQLRSVLGNGFVEVWGPIDNVSNKVSRELQKYQTLLTEEAIASGSPDAGKLVFQKTCGVCHRMNGEGGEIGPDLTGSNRTNTVYLLSNILDPSAELQDAYKLVVITTQDGRTYSGNIVQESDRNLTLRVIGQAPVIINQSQILNQTVSEKSMMPEGLLENLTDEEVIDLFAFMQKLEF